MFITLLNYTTQGCIYSPEEYCIYLAKCYFEVKVCVFCRPHRVSSQAWQALPTHLPFPEAQGAKAGEHWDISRQWSKLNGRVPHRIRDFSPQILQILVRSKC